MVRLCLNSIVRNEGARLVRMLSSVAPYIAGAVIADTGSTDDTKEIITDFCEAHRIPLWLQDVEFIDFSQARNAALAFARKVWCDTQSFDYFLLVDADMEIKVLDPTVFTGLTGASYDIYQVAGPTHYQNRRLLKADQSGIYRGVTHEYLDVATAGCLPEPKIFFLDHADGANRPDKFKRDIKLLKAGLRDEPRNERYFFYLAQSYRDAGNPVKAAEWYHRRVEAGGWDEEVWQAQVNYAHCLNAMGNEAGFILNLLIAYNMRPSRAESLYDLAHYFREKGKNPLGVLFAEGAAQIPYSRDALFVNDFVYRSGSQEELSICSFYVPGKEKRGFVITDNLSHQPGPYTLTRETARNNLFFYLPALKDQCPSFEWKQIGFVPPDGWAALNPSVTMHRGSLRMIVRTVNYRIDEYGRYLIRGTDGTANATNPIKTRNWLMNLGVDPMTEVPWHLEEVLQPGNKLPCEFPLVIGFEDMRLFSWQDKLWTSSTVRQIHPDGNCEQVLAEIWRYNEGPVVANTYTRMLRQPRVTEKNWAPISANNATELSFMWRPGVVVNTRGETIINKPPPFLTDNISGGSQVISFGAGYIALVHEAHYLPGKSIRYYLHRWIAYNADFSVSCMSMPFVFHEKTIEFAAGLCRHPDGDKLVISYGVRDAEARIATVDAKEVGAMVGMTL